MSFVSVTRWIGQWTVSFFHLHLLFIHIVTVCVIVSYVHLYKFLHVAYIAAFVTVKKAVIYGLSIAFVDIQMESCPQAKDISSLFTPPLPSNRHHRSSGDCLEGKRHNYQVCSVQYCVQQFHTVNCTHIWTDLTVLWIGYCLTVPISLCLDHFVYVLFCVWLYIACMCTV